jgi:hypothetical protein
MTGRLSQKIYCEAIAKTSGKRCRCKGYFTPTTKRYLCRFHGCSQSVDSKTRKYKGLFKNNTLSIDKKIIRLKNLKNFKHKTNEEIKQYIQSEEQKSSAFGYRTKYYFRHYLRWRTSLRRSKGIKNQLDDFLQILRDKSKV